MKIIFFKESMLKAVSVAQEVIATKSPMSILSNILLEAKNDKLTIKATDSTVKFVTTIPVDVIEEGIITIFCDKLMSILSALPNGDVELSKDESGIIIKPLGKKIKFKMKVLASDKFPEMNNLITADDVSFILSAEDLKELISQTIFAVATDRNRYFMTGIYLTTKENSLVAVATDGRRMSIAEKKSYTNFNGVIIPPKALNILIKNIGTDTPVSVRLNTKMIEFTANNFFISTTLIDGQYPKYERVIPDNTEHKFVISKKDLEDAMKRTRIMSSGDGRLSFNITTDEVSVYTPDTDIGSATEKITCKSTVENAELHLNMQYLADILKVIESENIELCFNVTESKITKAILVKGYEDSETNIKHIIMPIQA